jgi:DNA-binding transcriptional MerR regulator
MEQTKKLFSAKQFADRIGVSKSTVLNYQKRGILPDRRNELNNNRVFTEDDVQLMLSKIRRKPADDLPGGW